MAKIYGTPLMMGGSGGANKDLPPLLDNFKAFKGGGTSENPNITIQADKIEESRANELAGAVWVYGDHIPKNVNDGTKIQLTREEITIPDADHYVTLADIPASDAETETIVNLKESDGKLHPYIYLMKNYNSSGHPLLLRKNISVQQGVTGIWGEGGGTYYQWCNDTFLNTILDSSVSKEIPTVNISASKVSNGQARTVPLKVFALSVTEYGFVNADVPVEGSAIPYFSSNQRRIAYLNSGGAVAHYTRTTVTASMHYITTTGDRNLEYSPNTVPHGLRPAFCLPLTFKIKATPNENGSYDMYDEVSSISTFVSSEFTVQKSVSWEQTKKFYARQFTYNSKKQYQTMLEGAIATITLVGVPAPVSELAETHSGSSITLTWNNPTSDEVYDHTVVVYKTDAFPTAIDDGTQGYSGTDETATLSGLAPGSTYYIAVFTVSAYGLYGEPQTVQVEIPAGQLLSSLASGTKVKLGKWNNTDLQWKVARDTSDQSIRLVLEPTSVSLLGNKMWDNKEPSNSDSSIRSYGNNRYIYSNIHQWLNATKATGWYTAQHSTDAAPDYSSQAGFLSGWSENHIAALDRATLTTSRASVDGGGTETFVARVALISTTELGLQSGTGGGRLDIFNSDGDRSTGSNYWTRTPHPSNSTNACRVTTDGALSDTSRVYIARGVRPLCIPVSTALVSLEMDDDNCYIVQ